MIFRFDCFCLKATVYRSIPILRGIALLGALPCLLHKTKDNNNQGKGTDDLWALGI